MAQSEIVEEMENESSPSTPKKFRVQLDFAAEDFHEINALVKKLGVATRAELFRSALITLRWMYQKKSQGYSIVAMSADHQRLIEPEFTFLERAGRNRSLRDEEGAVAAS
jgi:hypothetical protein